MPDSSVQSGCPVADRDDRKTAGIAALRVKVPAGDKPVGSFNLARSILRSAGMKQAGLSGSEYAMEKPEHAAVFFLDGEMHRKKRAAIARFFTPKVIEARHQRVMEDKSDKLLGQFKAQGKACLDQMSWELAVVVAGEIVGLTIGLNDRKLAKLAKDIEGVMERAELGTYTGLKYHVMYWRFHVRGLLFHFNHVLPTIKARRAKPQDDIITHLVQEGYSGPGILIECMTYAGAGMVTTREFITMVAWHLFERPELRERFLASDKDEQTAMLEEILRLEPVATLLYRKADAGAEKLPETVAPGQTYVIDMRKANTDEAVTGACPFALDPDRAKRMNVTGSYLSFGDGNHRCPGAQVALTETRIFIDRLFRIPGIKLTAPPRIGWNDALMSYELRGAMVSCDKA